jgi:DNA-binding HxlR family transcriptional regulator
MKETDMSDGRRKVFDCPVEFTLDVLGGKWKAVLLAHLKDGSLGYGELRRRVSALSDKMLSQRLKELEAAGLVHKLAVEGNDGRFRYAMTARAQTLRPLLQALYDWGEAASAEMGVTIRAPLEPGAPPSSTHRMVR